MSGVGFSFDLIGRDRLARRGRLTTPHGAVEMPAFMPVGTLGAVKGLTIDQVSTTGAEMILGNAYHLHLRPGDRVVESLGGLHAFTGWDGPILTDSGGFQLFSLAQMTKVTECGAIFQSHIDGSRREISPEEAVAIQQRLGCDVAMLLDHVIELPAEPQAVADAMRRTIRWAQRSRQAHDKPDQAQFAIVQGGMDEQLRLECAEALVAIGFDGYAVGGLSVGEPPEAMYRTLDFTCPALPQDAPRYLMGVGRPQDLLEAIARGIDLFDCVMPTRNGRNALAFTDHGSLRLRNRQYELDTRPLEESCPCLACGHSRGYLRHLFMAKEMLGPILLTLHNLTYYQRLMREARAAIENGRYIPFALAKFDAWKESPSQWLANQA
ncbi:MAG: tRNA guanosine(34) transglycosylase Tgt [Pirellulales bacterium]